MKYKIILIIQILLTQSNSKNLEIATLGGGCFWCLELILTKIQGIDHTQCGYAGGKIPNPTYQMVKKNKTNYVEVVQIQFDPTIISYDQILKIFFKAHNPTQIDRQGWDLGKQYRSVIFYHNEFQREISLKVIKELNLISFNGKIVTGVEKIKNFYIAEGYHQNFAVNNRDQYYVKFVSMLKLEEFLGKVEPEFLKNEEL